MNPRNLLRLLSTGLIFAAAVVIGLALWRHYQYSPWTRDGRVKADVIAIAPDVSGAVVELRVTENQLVKRGDVLLRIDAERYQHALAEADAAVSARKADYDMKRSEAARRASLSGIVVSSESREASASTASSAAALYHQAQAARDTAALNLKRTEVLAPVDGYVSNLEVHAGDYANAGRPMLALVDAHSFRINGYFEETKLPYLHEGDAVRVRLMSGGPELRGHVDGISRGITDRDNPLGPRLLADVNPTFNWVRLAQRVPVRISLDEVPDGTVLVSGMTCTVIVEPGAAGG
ncbi:efflux RND transporter periplasmic adaptor subunit [Nevskia ramosa]|uniref:efflux RND transporter periplasmic adaptor subunit n=1 Tax=Nevskia ramosa TaxID=64002 RepID=UPI0003B35277|nr:HlyD family secretion protein [Nevskia ramosa]